jgi:RHS repeat-associated protein
MTQLRKSPLFRPALILVLLALAALAAKSVADSVLYNPEIESKYPTAVTSLDVNSITTSPSNAALVSGRNVQVFIEEAGGPDATISFDIMLNIEGHDKDNNPLYTSDLEQYFTASGATTTTGTVSGGWVGVTFKLKDFPCGANNEVKIEGNTPGIGAASINITFTYDCSRTSAGVNSVDYSLDLGKGLNGKSKAGLTIYAKDMFAGIYTPAAMQVAASAGLEVIRDTAGNPRQVKTGTVFSDIVPINPNRTEIRQYKAANSGSKSDGLYVPSGTPIKKIVLLNPDAPADPSQVPTVFNRLKVETYGAGGTTPEKELLYAWDPAQSTWSLSRSGESTESLQILTEAGIKTKTREVRDAGNALASHVVETFRTGAGDDQILTRTEEAGTGPNVVTTYTYYPNSSRLKRQERNDGQWEEFQYDSLGRQTKHYTGYAGAAVGDLGNAKLTETVYVEGGFPGLDFYEIESVKGQETGRTYVWRSGDELTTVRARTTQPGAAYGDPTNLSTTIERRASDGKVVREVNEAGIETTYSYSTSGGNLVTTATQSGPGAVRTVSTTNEAGTVIAETKTDVASGLPLESFTVTATDDLGRATAITYGDGTSEAFEHGDNCCGGDLISQTDRQGVTTTYVHDALGRVVETTRLGITESLTYDAADRVTKRERIGTDDSVFVQEETTYDMAGRVIARKDAMNQTTATTYAVASTGTTATSTFPDGGTRVETTFGDGLVKEISGTGVAPRSYGYGTWSGGTWVKESKSATEWVKTSSDGQGRPVKVEYPDGATATTVYNPHGQPVKQTDPDGVTALMEYDGAGRITRQTVDLNANGILDLGADRVTETAYSVVAAHGTTVNRVTTSVYASGSTPTIVRETDRSADGRSQWQTSFGQNSSVVSSTPSGGSWTTTTTNPDGTSTEQTITGTRVASSVQKASGGTSVTSTSMTYDAHGRLLTQTDARTGTTTFSYDNADRVNSQSAPAPTGGGSPLVTAYGYDSMGRRTSVTLPDNSVTTTGYDTRGNAISTGGSQQYDVAYTFDPQGRMLTMTTGGQAGNASTTWTYDSQRGWMTRKQYAGGKGTNYAYTAAGRLASRTWARTAGGSPLVTTYSYNAAGDLAFTAYSDSTPGVAMTYTRWGALATIADATGTKTITYNAQLKPDQEIFPASFFGGRILTRQYDSLNRDAGFQLGVTGNLNGDHEVAYGYDAAGRLAGVQDPNATWTYAFAANSANLVSGVTNGTKTISYTYETGRNAVTGIENKVGSTTVSNYTYTNNRLGQRTARSQSGTVFAASATESFGYNAKGEVTSSAHSADTTRNTLFNYDGIGNRNAASFAGGNTTYTANALNQYTEINPGTAVTPTYDDDGNMVSNGAGKRLVWDGENRLVEVRNADNDLIATYTYDGQSHRVKKVTTSAAPQGATEEVYLFDSWNRIATYASSNSTFQISHSYTWGRDLGGSLEAAGGVGGLLGISDFQTSNSYALAYDANGNVSELIDGSGNIAAHYEYDPFGNAVVATGSYATANPWRFSTKPVDAETGYSYYGYRCYNPVDGRWINRDPLGDTAFFNSQIKNKSESEYISLKDEAVHSQYVVLKNNCTNSIDSQGLNRWLIDSCLVLHTSVVVETWSEKCCRTGYLRIEFGPALSWSTLVLLVDGVMWCPGQVTISSTEKPSGTPIYSNCKADNILIDTAQLLEQNPPSYSFWAFNCRHFSAVILGIGL